MRRDHGQAILLISFSFFVANLSGSATASSYRQLYAFQGVTDGAFPNGSLINVGGTLYGTTSQGGDPACDEPYGCGTVFSVSPNGTEKVLFAFTDTENAFPSSGLTDVGGMLYGTTAGGAAAYFGTVFSIRPKGGTEKVLYTFPPSGGDGPDASLIYVHGKLYGTTSGLQTGAGEVFSVTPAGTGAVVYAFQTDNGTPAVSVAPLLNVGGRLFGTTGGCGGSCFGVSAVFSVTPDGTEKTVKYFHGKEGSVPLTGLTELGGRLYGTTCEGGLPAGKKKPAHGTVFSVTPGGYYDRLHTFLGGADGACPSGNLLNVGGTLYGTTLSGGTGNSGTVFSITPDGTETVIYAFQGGSDGAGPTGKLLDVDGALYGTTARGGLCPNYGGGAYGCGTVFSITP